MKTRIFMMAVAALLCAAPASAVEYDIKATCKEVAESVGGSSVIEAQCRKDEEAAKAKVDKLQAPEKALRWCDEVASTMGSGSYVILEQCIKDEMEAAGKL